MLKSNSAREIFYIFLWLGGIILLYTLVEMYILEPSHYNNDNTTHTEQSLVSHTTATEKNELAVSQKHTIPVVKADVHKTIEAHKTVAPVVLTKVIHKVEKLAVNDKVVAVKTETLKVTAQKKSPEHVVSESNKKEIKKTEKEVQKETHSPVEVLTTPSAVPEIVSIPSTVSIPTTPSIPSVPTMPNSKKTVTITKTTVAVKEQVQETAPVINALKKELSRDEEMKLIETARQHVIKKAEDARNAAMKALER